MVVVVGVSVIRISPSKGEIVSTLEGHTEGESVEAIEFVDLSGAGSSLGIVATGLQMTKSSHYRVAAVVHTVSLFQPA